MRQDGVRMASGWRQFGVRMASGRRERFVGVVVWVSGACKDVSGCVWKASGYSQEGVRIIWRQDGVRMTSNDEGPELNCVFFFLRLADVTFWWSRPGPAGGLPFP